MTAFVVSLLRVGAVVFAASALGWTIARALVPSEPRFSAERLGWSLAVAIGLLIAFVPLSMLVRVRPDWMGFLILSALIAASARRLAPLTLPSGRGELLSGMPAQVELPLPAVSGWGEGRSGRTLVWLLILGGVSVYALRALTEPMWANDFIAIWGLKGKTIFGAVGYPERLRSLEFAHPEYP
ncbi:MAG TPA: hypothetical protein VMT25_03780, partial [Thermoanaerobaculia bacterium]|nr:hypothetical protein [Thermoanaerobaculia bacterium]